MDDLISRQAAIDAVDSETVSTNPEHFKSSEKFIKFMKDADIASFGKWQWANGFNTALVATTIRLKALPSVQPEKEIAKRVLWTGWKGCRDTRYKCPNCKKPVKNDDIYCHRCGQKLMFPHISFTDYVPGEKQETIVRWDDE